MADVAAILTFKEACAALKVSDKTLRAAMKRGDITGAKIGASWRFRSDDINAYIEGAMCSIVEEKSGITTSQPMASAAEAQPSRPAKARRRALRPESENGPSWEVYIQTSRPYARRPTNGFAPVLKVVDPV